MSVIVDEQHPALFVILLDQSDSMSFPFSRNTSEYKSDIVASAVNSTIFELALKSMSQRNQNKMKDKFEVALIGYHGPTSAYASYDQATVKSVLSGPLKGKDVVKITELFDHSTREDQEGNPIWVEPYSLGMTPMKKAIRYAKDLCEEWINGAVPHTHCNPPVVLNITDGQATDITDGYDFSDLADEISELKNLRTEHGDLLYCNLFLSDSSADNCKYPSKEPSLDEYGAFLYKHSSLLTKEMKEMAERDYNYTFDGPNPRGIIVNGESQDIQNFLMIGTVGTIIDPAGQPSK